MKYEAVIGIEMHAELNTKTKIFCGCKTDYGAQVNTQCCPICIGLPGTLPTLNKKVVEYAVKMGLACGCTINRETKHDRKNYFYPDLPKAYQISQYDIPLCENGEISFYVGEEKKSVRILRIHIEEDAGKLLHDNRFSGTLIDFNRCGVPLIEIVSQPDLRSPEEARAYLDALKAILECLGICNCRMQEGNIRCDVNVSIRPEGNEAFGNRVEMKNVNTFSGAVRGIEFEIARQTAVLEAGGAIEQETRRWDDDRGESLPMRSKEDAQDYRYFPEPDLVPIRLDRAYVEEIQSSLPELPLVKFERYWKEQGLTQYEATMLSTDKDKASFYESCIAVKPNLAKQICNWILGDIAKLQNQKHCLISDLSIDPSALCELIELNVAGTLSSTSAKAVFDEMVATGKAPGTIVQEKGLAQVNDEEALAAIVEKVLSENQGPIAEYHNGKTNVLGFLVGQCMRNSKGKGNPQLFNKLLAEHLNQ
ncbi:MAG: Asp-tRNA(Asn)/Glu-tRNA(Gln) amidotransferase subunit GatB [Clostridia bacterium]|nr:Asp-tRNA(Asn)/Glu-tRNA(Gln) amidotransferase subunit GatB [Clostridia bacterium]